MAARFGRAAESNSNRLSALSDIQTSFVAMSNSHTPRWAALAASTTRSSNSRNASLFLTTSVISIRMPRSQMGLPSPSNSTRPRRVTHRTLPSPSTIRYSPSSSSSVFSDFSTSCRTNSRSSGWITLRTRFAVSFPEGERPKSARSFSESQTSSRGMSQVHTMSPAALVAKSMRSLLSCRACSFAIKSVTSTQDPM